MRIVYNASGEAGEPFEFLVLSKRDRPLSASADEIRGLATIESGHVVIKSLTVTADDVTTTTVRFPLGALREQLQRDVHTHPELLAWATSGYAPDAENPFLWTRVSREEREQAFERVLELVATLKGSSTGSGRKPLPDETLRAIAVMYLACAEDHPHNAAQALAEQLWKSRKHAGVSPATVRGWIRRAREAGWLGEAEHNRVIPTPGPRLLAEQHQEEEAKQ